MAGVVKNKKFEPVVWSGNEKYHVQEINLGKLFLNDGRKLHWEYFFKREAEFKIFMQNFEKLTISKRPDIFLNDFQTLLAKYNTIINIDNDPDDRCVLKFDINGVIIEIKDGKSINSQRILDIISLREKLNA